jgi:hypothetical protein
MVSSRSGGNFNETPRTRVTLASAIKNCAKGGMKLADYLIREDSVTAFFMAATIKVKNTILSIVLRWSMDGSDSI